MSALQEAMRRAYRRGELAKADPELAAMLAEAAEIDASPGYVWRWAAKVRSLFEGREAALREPFESPKVEVDSETNREVSDV